MRRHILLYLFVVILLVLSSFASALITRDDEDLVFLYEFDEASSPIMDLKDNSHPNIQLTCPSNAVYQDTPIDSITSFSINFSNGGFCSNTSATAISLINSLNSNNWTFLISVHQKSDATEDVFFATNSASNGLSFRMNNDAGGAIHVYIDNSAIPLVVSANWRDTNALIVVYANATSDRVFVLNGTEALNDGGSNGLLNTVTGISFGAHPDSTLQIPADSKIGFGAMFNRTLTTTEIQSIIDNGIPIEGLTTPTYQLPTPTDNARNNTNQTINCTTTDTTTNLRFYLNVSLAGGDLDMPYLFNVTATGEGHRTFATNFSDGVYTYDCFVQNITNGVFSSDVSRTLTIDTVSPTITLNPNNAFNTSNISSHNQYLNFMFLNITFNDETGLFATLINVTQGTISYFNNTNTTLNNALSHNFTRNVSTVSWPDGVFDIEITVSDGSTVFSIEDYGISQFISRITFDTEEGNRVDIIGSGAISTDYEKNKDRYEFGFNYLTAETTRKFTVNCDNELFYMNNPKKEGHFVCWNSEEKTGNWIDFEGIGKDYTVKKVNDKEYDITFINLPSSKQVWIKSIGGLNVVTENYQWFKGSTTNTFLAAATSDSKQDFSLNISSDFDLIKNITASFSYNNTLKSVTKTNLISSILFNLSFNVPSVNQTLNFSWDLNVTQRNDNKYSFFLNSSQQLVTSQVNLSIFDEENQTLITEDLIIFFSGPTSVQTNTSSGTLSVGNLDLGEYFIQAESTNYPRRGLFFTVTNASAKVGLYLVNDRAGNDFIDYIIQDDGRNRLDNVRLTFQKSINNSFVTVAQIETDFAGQARIFQDQQNEYRIVLFLAGFATQTIDLIPLLTQYTITLATLTEQIFQTTYEGIRYTISPAARVLNASGLFRDISFTVFDGTSSLEFFGLQIINHSYTCIPANCLTNITGSPAGGTATVQINLSEAGSFDTFYFFKRNGFPLQFINGQRGSVRLLIGDRLADNFATIGVNLGTPVMRSIFATILITVLVVLASQMGVIGLGLMLVISFGTIFFMLLGFIPRMVAMITLFFGVAIFFVLGREQ